MASEVAERLNGLGLPTNLLTGQEVVSAPGARHVSCTVEMAPLGDAIHCAVVDEAQLLGDPRRGWAFTRAFLGLPAAELHVCGSPSLLPLCLRLAAACGDAVETRHYDRLAPLEVGDADSVAPRFVDGRWRGLRRGDCLVAFSRRRLFELKREVDATSAHRASIIYGGLPPDARREQARLFNQSQRADDGNVVTDEENDSLAVAEANDYGVLVASDAVGMGLNLSIGRVIFTSLEKFDGERQRSLTSAEAKQVAGRAGRFKSPHPVGTATATSRRDLAQLRALLAARDPPQQQAGLFPTLGQLKQFHHQERHREGGPKPRLVLSELFEAFEAVAQVESRDYFLCDLGDAAAAASLIDHVSLSVRDRYTHCLAPLSPDDPVQASWFVHYASELASIHAPARAAARAARPRRAQSAFAEAEEDEEDELDLSSTAPSPYFVRLGFGEPRGGAAGPRAPRTAKEVAALETQHAVVDLWLWLAQRFPTAYRDVDVAAARQLQTSLSALVERGLQAITARDNEGAGVVSDLVSSGKDGRFRAAAANATAGWQSGDETRKYRRGGSRSGADGRKPRGCLETKKKKAWLR